MENESSKIFGIRAVIEAINAGKTISKVYLQKDLSGHLFSELATSHENCKFKKDDN